MNLDSDALAVIVRRRAASPAPLDRLGAAVGLAEDLRVHGDRLLDRFVEEARGAGCSWTEIGATLGISKQAAHQRFLTACDATGGWPPNATGLVRAALATAQEEARSMGHPRLATEHALLGLVAERDGAAAHALSALGV